MKLSQRLYKSVEEIWNAYDTHPFVSGIGNGSLSIDRFRFYMVQDYLYLLDYAKVFALGVVKSKTERAMRAFAGHVEEILNGEMDIHKTYAARLGITEKELQEAKPAIANLSYTKYMLEAAYSGQELEILAAILSCSWSYKQIAERLAKKEGALTHAFYGEWVQGYTSEGYVKTNAEIIAMLDALGEGCDESRYAHLEEIFITCSRYEALFWDMAYGKEMDRCLNFEM